MVKYMTKSEANGVFEISRACFSMPWSLDGIMAELDNKNSVTLVYMEGDNVVGFVNAHFVLDEGYINNIAVSTKRAGIGGKLLANLIKVAASRKLAFLSLEVRESNSCAIAFYEKYGFFVAGMRKNFYDKPQESALIYSKNLL